MCGGGECCLHTHGLAHPPESRPSPRPPASHDCAPVCPRRYILGYCHFQLATLLNKRKELVGAHTHFERALTLSEPEFMYMPEILFNLAVLSLLTFKKGDSRSDALVTATNYFNNAMEAEKRLLKWLHIKPSDVTKRLGKALIKRFAQSLPLRQT